MMILRAALILFALAGTACSSGGSGGGIVDDGLGIAGSFAPDQPSPSSLTVSAAQEASAGDLVTVRIDVTGIDSVFAALFVVTTPVAGVEFVDWLPGTLLESGGQVAYFVNETAPGEVTVDAASLGGSGVDVTASSPLIYLVYRVNEPGAFALAFQSTELLDAGPPLPQAIGGLTWYGGALQGR